MRPCIFNKADLLYSPMACILFSSFVVIMPILFSSYLVCALCAVVDFSSGNFRTWYGYQAGLAVGDT